MRKFGLVFVVLFFILFAVLVLKDQILKSVITTAGEKMVGAKVSMDSFKLGLLSQSVEITNFKLFNPPGFPQEPMVIIGLIKVDLDAMALLKNQIHVQVVELDLKEVSLVSNVEGKLNVDSLKVVQDQKAAGKEKSAGGDAAKAEKSNLQIDVARINIGKVVHKKMRAQGDPLVEVYDANVKNKVYRDIKSPEKLAVAVLFECVKQTAIRNAAIYGAANLMGVAFLPAGILAVVTGDADSSADFDLPRDVVFGAAELFLTQKGKLANANKETGIIKGKYEGFDIVMKISNENRKTKLLVTAKRFMLPKAQIAGGIVHQILQQLGQ